MSIKNNTTSLQELLEAVNNLPNAGSGSGSTDDLSISIIEGTITAISDDRVKTIREYAFYNCINLTSVNFPSCTEIKEHAFNRCVNLTTANLQSVKTIGTGAFYRCNITTASFPTATFIDHQAFYKCYNLKSLYLTGSILCKIYNSDVFASTPIGGYSASAGTYGSIYVPASLLTSYKTATNWTYFSSRFVGI